MTLKEIRKLRPKSLSELLMLVCNRCEAVGVSPRYGGDIQLTAACPACGGGKGVFEDYWQGAKILKKGSYVRGRGAKPRVGVRRAR